MVKHYTYHNPNLRNYEHLQISLHNFYEFFFLYWFHCTFYFTQADWGYNKQMRQTDPPYELKLEGCNKFNSSYYSVWIFKIASVHYQSIRLTEKIHLALCQYFMCVLCQK